VSKARQPRAGSQSEECVPAHWYATSHQMHHLGVSTKQHAQGGNGRCWCRCVICNLAVVSTSVYVYVQDNMIPPQRIPMDEFVGYVLMVPWFAPTSTATTGDGGQGLKKGHRPQSQSHQPPVDAGKTGAAVGKRVRKELEQQSNGNTSQAAYQVPGIGAISRRPPRAACAAAWSSR
jgi:hypothetical protein